MVKINENFLKLPGSYLFSEVARRIRVYGETHPGAEIIKLSIGDVTRPLVPAVTQGNLHLRRGQKRLRQHRRHLRRGQHRSHL